MKRVASLYLPYWPIDRLRRIERRHAPPAEASGRAARRTPVRSLGMDGRSGTGQDRSGDDAGPSPFDALGAEAAAERAQQCSVSKEGGWRPGARWARTDRWQVEAAVEALPRHQRPPQRELGRVSEVADNPFRKRGPARPPEERVAPPASLRELSRRTEAAEHPFKPGARGGSEPAAPAYGQGRFFQTGRTQGSVVARLCRAEGPAGPAPTVRAEPPLVTTHKIGPRVEIAAADPAARALGLAPGLALTMARAQVPGLEVRPADPDGDAADLRILAERLARRWAPTVSISDKDGLFIDLTGVAHLHGGETRFARRLVRLMARQGIMARVAVADTAGAAWALARYGNGDAVTVVEPDRQAAAIAPLPVAALRLEPAALELLARLGVETVGQLFDMPRAPLVRRFGRTIVGRLDQATGGAAEPLDPIVPPTRISVEQRFAEPIATAEAIGQWLHALMPRLTRRLAESGQGARAVELTAARVDGVPQRLRLGFARPTRDPEHMLRLALRRIEEIEPGYGIDALALDVRRADPLGPEPLAPTPGQEAEPDLAPLVDAIVNRIGADRLWRVTPIESDVPERSLRPASPLNPPPDRERALKPDDVRRLDTRATDHPWHPRWPRPVRLLRRPEQVDHVLAELPDQPPRRFTWRGAVHRVVRAEGPERIAGEWWRRPGERQAVRDYFRVEDERGQRFWLYRRGDALRTETGDLRWFLHGRGG